MKSMRHMFIFKCILAAGFLIFTPSFYHCTEFIKCFKYNIQFMILTLRKIKSYREVKKMNK